MNKKTSYKSSNEIIKEEKCSNILKSLSSINIQNFKSPIINDEYISALTDIEYNLSKLMASRVKYIIIDANNLFNNLVFNVGDWNNEKYSRLNKIIDMLFSDYIEKDIVCYESIEVPELNIYLRINKYGNSKDTEYYTYKDSINDTTELIIINKKYIVQLVEFIKSLM